MGYPVSWKDKLALFFSYLKEPTWQKALWQGLGTTVEIAVWGLCIGIVIGTLIAVVKVAPKYKKILRVPERIADVYVAVFRGTPIVVQLLIGYYIVPPLFRLSGINAVRVGITVFGMNSGAYVSEIMRGGLRSVDVGQMEAGRALGLSFPATMCKIVVPQAVKNIVPMLGNELISLIKETSVLSFISISDVYTVIRRIGSVKYEFSVPYLALALVYIVMVLAITGLIRLIERLFARSDRDRGTRPKRKKEIPV